MKENKKLKKLEEIIKGYDNLIVALSGGVDSTFLLAFAHQVYSSMGRTDCLAALTATGPQFAEDEIAIAGSLCDRLGIAHKKIDVSHVINMIKRNPADRCYHCKHEIFGILKERADMVGSVLADGTNLDDMEDYRPGYKAIKELGIASPLKEAELTKTEIREALSSMDIPEAAELAARPAFACLVSRIPYGETITERKLEAIYAAEQYLKERGFSQVRVRCHEIAGKVSGNETRFMARIELEADEMERFCKKSPNGDTHMACTESRFRELGFEYVTLDIGGYRKGRMNDILQSGAIQAPDRIKVTETARRGRAENVENAEIMAQIDSFLKEIREKEYKFDDFRDIIEKLRMPDGCPWDREQTHESLKKHMVEEVNEALEAIDEQDWKHLCEELGDVLLQIVLHAQIAKEAGEFTMDDIIQCVSEKMIRRHPHVFGSIDVSGVDEGLDLWEEIKKREKQFL